MSPEAVDLSFLSVIDLACVKCQAKKATFVCFCGKDVCLDCATSHQRGCKPAIDLTFKKDPIPVKKTGMGKKKRRR